VSEPTPPIVRRHLRAGWIAPDHAVVRSFAQGESEGVDKDRFTRAGLTGQYAEAWIELQLLSGNDGKITYL
jgi:hypothetical protein